MKNKVVKILPFVYFSTAILLIVILFPKEGRFSYSFMEGRPWKYGLLTAPFDFPIYKSTSELKKEQDSIVSDVNLYFRMNKEVLHKQLQSFNDFCKNNPENEYWTIDYKRYIHRVLTEIYSVGILSNEDYERMKRNRSSVLMVLENNDNEAKEHLRSKIFNTKSAYSYIIENHPNDLSIDVLRSGNLNNYLHENLKYDSVLTEKVKREDLQKVAPSDGMVQAGEKIVDKGEIITEKTYNILRSLKQIYDKDAGSVQKRGGLILGSIVLIGFLMMCLLFYLIYFRQRIYTQKNVIFVLFMTSIFIFLTEIAVSYSLFNVYIIPYAIIPIVIRTFFESRTALMAHLISIFVCSLMIPFPFEFILIQFIVSMVAVFILKDLTQRSELIKCAFYIFFTYVITYFSFLLLQDGNFSKIDWFLIIYFGINFLFVMFAYPFIYILEKIFGYISNVTLVELSDINTPALSSLSEICPGTFQHSLQVSMLGTAAAMKIGANPQLVRTGALYHDLGKMVNPAFFIENRLGNTNPHDKLSLEESARIITSHVPDGVKKAAEFNLPPAIVKFILTHHGKGKAKYFYNTWKNHNPDTPIDEKVFSYKGNNPDTMETAILMMADSVEAASRSLKDYSEESIRALVDKIIDSQIADGLLNDAPLTFKNITTVKEIFVEKLMSMYHSRITYPDLKQTKQDESEKA
ncbi:MAG: HDIG domain-containing protein [Dysgonamonadaceae bacterium]|jgi:putative nucleotidyltransferase with HDIG domain|nr:HDIG domain-containing protein [Dysgonamonadaceae bacterium]